MWLPNLADVAWMTDVLSHHGGTLGLPGDVAAVELLDARLTHPFGPGSPRCRGWATYLVTSKDADPVRLYVKGFPTGGESQAVCKVTATSVQNQIRSMFAAWMIGSTTGTTTVSYTHLTLPTILRV